MGQAGAIEARSPLLIERAARDGSASDVEMSEVSDTRPVGRASTSGLPLRMVQDMEMAELDGGETTEDETTPEDVRREQRRRRARLRLELADIAPCPRMMGGPGYLAYCVLCLCLTVSLLVATLFQNFGPRREVRIWRRTLRREEEVCEAIVGVALCTETFAAVVGMGCRRFFGNKLRVFDLAIASLTLLCGIFFLLRRLIRTVDDIAEDVDIPMLLLRFSLQPFRMVSTASMVVRAHSRFQRDAAPVETPIIVDPRQDFNFLEKSNLSPQLASEIRELLPMPLRFCDWHLAYAPPVHGTSVNTFYRRQSGPNVVVVRDAQGGIFGGFAPEPWARREGNFGGPEAFLFAVRATREAPELGASGATQLIPVPPPADVASPGPVPELHLEVFRFSATGTMRNAQWGDHTMFGLGAAIVFCDEFIRGTSAKCEFFGNLAPLSPSGTEFTIRDFECWSIGTDKIDQGYVF